MRPVLTNNQNNFSLQLNQILKSFEGKKWSEVEDEHKTFVMTSDSSRESFNRSINLKISQKIVQTLLNTDSTATFLNLPFPEIFIDCEIELKRGFVAEGILVCDLEKSNVFEKYLSKEEKLRIFRKNSGHTNIHFICVPFRDKEGNKSISWHQSDGVSTANPLEGLGMINLHKINCFLFSLLEFLYFPEVELIQDSSTRQNRINNDPRVKIKSNDEYVITITGKIRRYVNIFHNSLRQIGSKKAHIVRGFYRHFRSEYYVRKRGQSIFIPPFVKGIGEVSKKQYLVKAEDERIWVKEQQLADIVRNIYPEQPILRNYRLALDGLEIDIYLPLLKLGIEYNGEQHYQFVKAFHKSKADFLKQQERDKKKNQIAKIKEITLISVPFTQELTLNAIKSIILSSLPSPE